MKNLFYLFTLLVCSTTIWAQPTITKSGGWFETAYAEWTPENGVDNYNVYYSGNGITNKKIDWQLVRVYKDGHMRADVPGLKAGSYTLKIVSVKNGTEGTPATTSSLSVLAHDRAGFAFANNRVPGAYNADGTPKTGAVILYLTEENKDDISLDITGASTNPCVGIQTILDGIKKGKDTRPFIIRVIGQVSTPAISQSGDIVIENSNNSSSYITLEGIGEDATADKFGIRIKNASNVEIRNIGVMNVISSEGDNVGLQQGNDYIWVHNVDFFYGGAGGDADQAKGDGALDCKKSTYVTFSYNHFWDSGKCNLLGLSEGTTSGLYITYHHNWYDHSDSRHPRVRFYSAHVYNNYYDGNAKYGIGSTLGSSVFSEGNYFRNCKYPMLTSMQGSDIAKSWDASSVELDAANYATFSKEAGGTIKAFNNYIEGGLRFVKYGDKDFYSSTVQFDAYVTATRSETVPSSIKSFDGANTYNNFDTDASVMYSYTADEPAVAKTKVTTYAGRLNGGDFKWTFNNAVDDESYAVNAPLKTALLNYVTKFSGYGIVDVNIPPVVSMTTDAATYAVNGNIIISATASDADGVAKVAFYNGSTLLQEDTSSPYSYTISSAAEGTYKLTAVATDTKGASSTSDVVTVTVGTPNTAPTVALTSDKTSYKDGDDIILTATAADADGSVAKVTFYNGSTVLSEVTSSPYSYTLAKPAKGTYTLSAVAIDNKGLESSKSEISVKVNDTTSTTYDIEHDFTLSGSTSSFFTITGNLSTSKGTETFGSLTLTQCLKMESATAIDFTLTNSGQITLVFNAAFTGNVKIDGNNYVVTNGIVTVSLDAGSHSITKGDSANLYFIGINIGTTTLKSALFNNNCKELKVYPNPMKANGSIAYNADEDGELSLKVYSGNSLLNTIDLDGSKGSIKWSTFHINAYGIYTVILYCDGAEIAKQYVYIPK